MVVFQRGMIEEKLKETTSLDVKHNGIITEKIFSVSVLVRVSAIIETNTCIPEKDDKITFDEMEDESTGKQAAENQSGGLIFDVRLQDIDKIMLHG